MRSTTTVSQALKKIRVTPAFKFMAWLTGGAGFLTLVSWLLGRFALWVGRSQVPQGVELVLSQNSTAITVWLGVLTLFCLGIWGLIAFRRI